MLNYKTVTSNEVFFQFISNIVVNNIQNVIIYKYRILMKRVDYMFNKKEEKVSTEKINDVLGLTKKILKLVYIFMFLIGIYAATLVCKELKIVSFLLSFIEILSPLFIGIIIAWLLEPMIIRLQKKGVNRVLGTVIVYVVLIAIIYFIIWALFPLILDQINDLVAAIPNLISSVQNWLDSVLKNDLFSFINKDELFKSISDFGLNLSTNLPLQAVNVAKNIMSSLGTFAFGLIIGFYMLFNFNDVSSTLLTFIPEKFKYDVSYVGTKVNTSLRNYVMSILFLATLIFVVCSIGFTLTGLKAPLLFGFICGITDLIPYIGPWIGGAIAVIVGFSNGIDTGLLTLLVVFISQMLESFVLQPVIMSKTMKLHPVTVILGLLIFQHFFGIFGMLVATPVIACLKIIFTYIDSKLHFFSTKEESANSNLEAE